MICKCCKQEIPEVADMYWQRSPRYKGVKIGNSQTSFQNYGCFICSLSYVVEQDPLEVMKKLVAGGGLVGDMINTKAYDILGLEYKRKETDINKAPIHSPTIKEVQLGKSQHFVVRLIRDGKKLIFDPWENKELPIDYYPFKSYRIFTVK
jgi:hypothetical protein